MNLRDYIAQLQAVLDAHGNLEVVTPHNFTSALGAVTSPRIPKLVDEKEMGAREVYRKIVVFTDDKPRGNKLVLV